MRFYRLQSWYLETSYQRMEWSFPLLLTVSAVAIGVCGNAIKYAYELFNGVTGQRLFPIGSDCVSSFHPDCLLTSNWKRRKTAKKGWKSNQKSSEKGKNQGHLKVTWRAISKMALGKGVFKTQSWQSICAWERLPAFPRKSLQGEWSWTKAGA